MCVARLGGALLIFERTYVATPTSILGFVNDVFTARAGVDPDHCRQWRRVHFCCCGVDPRGRVVPDAARSKNQGGNRYVGVRGVGEPGDGGNLELYRCGSTDI